MRLLLNFVLLFASTLSHAASNFEPSIPPGPLPVGFRVVQQYDFSRVFLNDYDSVTGRAITGEPARPIQTLVWYPSTRSGTAMRYGDYLQLTGSELDFVRSREEARASADSLIYREYVSESGPKQARLELDAAMRARRDALRESGKFPVVIYVPSVSAPAAENADLCEYLASHGYVVLASPSVGLRSKAMSVDLEGAETAAADVAFLISYARTLPNADTNLIAVMGYSWGGIANVLAAAKDSRIKALVNLDGSVRYYPDLMAAAKYAMPERATAPMLYIAARPMSIEDIAARGKPPASFLNDMKHADLYKLTMYAMEHFAFSSTYLRFAKDIRFNQYSREEVNRAYGSMMTYTKHFLDAYLKNDITARAVLGAAPLKNGMAAHAATMDVRLATAKPPSRERLAAELARQDFRNAHAVYTTMYGQENHAHLSETELNAWGYALLGNGAIGHAVELFRLTTQVYPNSANAFDSLAEAYTLSGDKNQAILNYRRSLNLDPKNDNARRQLQALEAAVQPSASERPNDKAS